jgi:hypothetical protein
MRFAYQRMAADRNQAIHRRGGKDHLAGEDPEEAENEEKTQLRVSLLRLRASALKFTAPLRTDLGMFAHHTCIPLPSTMVM